MLESCNPLIIIIIRVAAAIEAEEILIEIGMKKISKFEFGAKKVVLLPNQLKLTIRMWILTEAALRAVRPLLRAGRKCASLRPRDDDDERIT